MTEPYDPFEGGDSAPAISWKNAPDGTIHTLTLTKPMETAQSRKFGSKDPDFWPAKVGQAPEPKMAVVYNGTDENGEERSVWAIIRGEDLFFKIKDAQEAIAPKYRATTGDKITMKLLKREPTDNGFDKKVFAVKVERGTAPAAPVDDPWGDDAPPF
jgi:hypothetical protein